MKKDQKRKRKKCDKTSDRKTWLVVVTTLVTTLPPIILKSLDLAIAIINNGN
ncbi:MULTISPECIES: hypothetical protein [Brevibacillus]|uniref:hypothetical protein n=1 Tax=Brevibacillus TaxID=55080 RepID=UPI001304D780|nr:MULTISPECIES: hypothetical protein [Brevibacillus]MED1948714.1 hypothetical protein [Brevibacillus formosus]MED2000413.1 hypothetical protein [Brevibacillus formosus]MED2085565.1 hypothetical protein [Brevibacillus formosus]